MLITNYLDNATKVAKLAGKNSRPQPAMNNGVRHSRSTWLALIKF